MVGIANHQQSRVRPQRGDERVHQYQIDHGELVDHREIGVDVIIRPATEALSIPELE